MATDSAPIIIKRYARQRLYEGGRARYVSIDQLRFWAEAGIGFSVIDTETGDDITDILLA